MAKKDIQIRKILVPLAMKAWEISVIEQALFFQKTFGAKLIFFHVITDGPLYSQSEEAKSKRKGQMLSALCQFVWKVANEEPSNVEFRVKYGEVVNEVNGYAQTANCDLVIIKNTDRIKGMFTSYKKHKVDRIIGEAICPVITVKEDWSMNGVKNILVPVDIMKPYKRHIHWAIEMAKAFGAKIKIVSVLSIDVDWENSTIHRKTNEITRLLNRQGVKSEIKVLKANHRDTYQLFLDYAQQQDRDLLFISTHDESLIDEKYIGKFATEIIHRAKKPVFCVALGNETIMRSLFSIFKADLAQETEV